MKSVRLFGVSVLAIGLGLTVLLVGRSPAGDKGTSLLPPPEFAKLVTHDAKFIQDALAKGELEKKNERKVSATAFMIAVYAQNSMTKGAKNAKELATLRDTALGLVKAVKDSDHKAAASLAAALSPNPKADPNAKLEPIVFEKVFEFEDIMHQFSSERVGGFGLERELDDLVESKDALTPAQMERLAYLGYKLAMIGYVADSYAADKNEGGKKTIKNWHSHTDNFRKVTVALSEVAKTKNEANTRAALDRVTKSCTKCHDDFRP